MAVFTRPLAADLKSLQEAYGIPETLRLEGIHGGIENSNFLVYRAESSRPEWVLTLVEANDSDAIFVAELQTYLASSGLPAPKPVPTACQQLLAKVQGRPALLYPFLSGHHPTRPTAGHCERIGAFLASLHCTPWPPDQQHPLVSQHTQQWLEDAAGQVWPALDLKQQQLLDSELEQQAVLHWDHEVICHGDLFHDNALFSPGAAADGEVPACGPELNGVIDWHNVGLGPALFDLAVACSDWCRIPDRQIDANRMQALLQGYCRNDRWRELADSLQPFLRRAALRFWLSRLQAQQQPATANAQVTLKNPEEYRRLLEDLRRNGSPLRNCG